MSAGTRYIAVLTFCAGMLVAGVLVPLATRSGDREIAAVGAAPTAAAELPSAVTDATTPAVPAAGPATGTATATATKGTPAAATASTARSTATSTASSGVQHAAAAPAAAAPAVQRGPSDVGVTADTVKVGVILADLAGASKLVGGLAGAGADEQQAALQAFIDETNGQGGINGRKITPVYTRWDPVAGDANVNCNQLTEDDKVFAVISEGIYGSPVLCVTQQHGTPMVNPGGYIDEYYSRSRGLLFTMLPTKPRSAGAAVLELEREGQLKGKTIGVFASRAGDDDVAVDKGTVPVLNRLGYKVAHISRLSADSSSSSQIPVEVNQMRAAGVDLVFLQTNVVFDSQFVQQADSQGYRPLYALGDSESNVSDFFLSNMPASFQAIGVSSNRTGEQRVGAPESSTDADCRRVVEVAAHTTLERGSAGYETALGACNLIRLFVRGARAAGVALTRAGFSAGMQGVGVFQQAYTQTGSFRNGKFNAADFARPLHADMGCKCWKPAGDFQRIDDSLGGAAP